MNKKVAIPVSNGVLDAHFGHCKNFMLFDLEGDNIVTTTTIDAPPHEPGLLPKHLAEQGVTDIVAGGMGGQAIQLFQKQNINVFVGAPQLEAATLIAGFINKTLNFTANYCDH